MATLGRAGVPPHRPLTRRARAPPAAARLVVGPGRPVFSDLVLVVPVAAGHLEHPGLGTHGDEAQLVVLGQMRPDNRPTLVEQDLVGQTVNETAWRLSAQSFHEGKIVRGTGPPSGHRRVGPSGERAGALRQQGHRRPAAGLLAPRRGPTSMYETTYLEVFERLAKMAAESGVPLSPTRTWGPRRPPGAGDGCVVVDAEGRVIRLAQRHQRLPPHGRVRSRPIADGSPSWASRSRRSSGRGPRLAGGRGGGAPAPT